MPDVKADASLATIQGRQDMGDDGMKVRFDFQGAMRHLGRMTRRTYETVKEHVGDGDEQTGDEQAGDEKHRGEKKQERG